MRTKRRHTLHMKHVALQEVHEQPQHCATLPDTCSSIAFTSKLSVMTQLKSPCKTSLLVLVPLTIRLTRARTRPAPNLATVQLCVAVVRGMLVERRQDAAACAPLSDPSHRSCSLSSVSKHDWKEVRQSTQASGSLRFSAAERPTTAGTEAWSQR